VIIQPLLLDIDDLISIFQDLRKQWPIDEKSHGNDTVRTFKFFGAFVALNVNYLMLIWNFEMIFAVKESQLAIH
jgi:hypothetical protein